MICAMAYFPFAIVRLRFIVYDLFFAIIGAMLFRYGEAINKAIKKLIKRKPAQKRIRTKKKQSLTANILLMIIAAIFSFIAIEIVLHLALPPAYQISSKYGWDIKENSSLIAEFEDSSGYKRNVTANYTTNGFKRWGNVNTNKTKMLIIGDSFTEMLYVSNGEEWYAYLEKEFPEVEFFVKGVRGYGSLQEYMILNDTIDEINPDVILWQFCPNDYENNYLNLDLSMFPFNDLAYRPYLENNKIVYRMPVPFQKLREYSRIADYTLKIYDKGVAKKLLKAKWGTIGKKRFLAYDVTLEIMSMAKTRVGSRHFFLFSVNPLNDFEEHICLKTNITCIENVSESVEIRGKDENVTIIELDNMHWNIAGNKFAGEYLADYFRNNTEFMEIISN
jgi:hypothetical protein